MAVANPGFLSLRAARQGPESGGDLRLRSRRRAAGALGKALAERGIDPKKIKVMGQGEITDEHALAAMGDAAIGIVTAFHYDYRHKSKMNEAFVKAYNADFHRNPDFFSVGAWDGMHLIYAALKKTRARSTASR